MWEVGIMGEDVGLNQGMVQTVTFQTDGSVDDDVVDGMDAIDGVRSVERTDDGLVVTFDPTVVDENALREAFENDGQTPLAGGGVMGNRNEGLFGMVGEVSDNVIGKNITK
jgi:hypothetical protein